MNRFLLALLLLCAPDLATAEGVLGYYRYPALAGDSLIFAAEGDLWVVGVEGGLARRLTTHPGEETHPAVSPDGRLLAFSAEYEGPREVYVMPVTGGLPRRLTWEAEGSIVSTWRPDGALVYMTRQPDAPPYPDLSFDYPDPGGG